MAHPHDPFAPALHTAHVWLRRITEDLATEDRAFAYRLTRAWLHTVRDRLDVGSAAHVSAQLPELLRGIFFEGWVPAHVPVAHDPSSFLRQFGQAAGVSEDEAYGLVWLVSDAMRELLSPGELEHVCTPFPDALRVLLLGASTGPSGEEPDDAR
ncbi:DUF2267 domain-containing protein [Nocardia lijiangensis]|uniref:DUF2267 domain-containing protein n=1 Tax=Nocardia lijiangensis TaxID=299618 RepID=UPI00082D7A64|nr:DUF2267 domain-containing protein [Nocardia lijiangensis]